MEGNSKDDPKPRLQFILDLQAWIHNIQSKGLEILLALDANEDISGLTGTHCFVPYGLDSPIKCPNHNRSLSTFISSCGLCDPLIWQHQVETPPPTYSRGQSRIDYIFVSASLLPAVQRSRILPFDRIFLSGHRPCFIDLDATLLFGNDTPTIQTIIGRGLRLQDPRTVTKYLEILQEQLDYHNFETKVQHLHDAASNNAFNGNLEKIYETLDMLLTESMRHAESKCSTPYSKKYNWSPVLKAAVKEVRYWQLRLKQTKGFTVRDSTLRQAAKDTNLGKEETATAMSLLKIVDRVRSARAHLKELQKQHVELRMNHLESLAEAILLH